MVHLMEFTADLIKHGKLKLDAAPDSFENPIFRL